MVHTTRQAGRPMRTTESASVPSESPPSADEWILRKESPQARSAADEYRRAHRDYTQLVRHRIANPLTAIRGNAQTLLDMRNLSDDLRERLLVKIVEMAERIEHLSLDPAPQSVEERCLNAMPCVEAV